MKDALDSKTAELLPGETRAQRFRKKQLENGLRQYAFWLTQKEAADVRKMIANRRPK